MYLDDNKLPSYIILGVRYKKLIIKAVLTKENTLKKKIVRVEPNEK